MFAGGCENKATFFLNNSFSSNWVSPIHITIKKWTLIMIIQMLQQETNKIFIIGEFWWWSKSCVHFWMHRYVHYIPKFCYDLLTVIILTYTISASTIAQNFKVINIIGLRSIKLKIEEELLAFPLVAWICRLTCSCITFLF